MSGSAQFFEKPVNVRAGLALRRIRILHSALDVRRSVFDVFFSVTTEHPRIPICTYRLQLNRWFTFAQAREIVSYLRDLGVSDVYASPYFQAAPDSIHGYDITDHNKLNAAIGSEEDYKAWIEELHRHGMGQVL